MDSSSWDLIPDHTNIVESAHASHNESTGSISKALLHTIKEVSFALLASLQHARNLERPQTNGMAALHNQDLNKLEEYRCSLSELKTLVNKSLQQSKNLDNWWKATQSELKLMPKRDPCTVWLVTQKDEIKNDQEHKKSNQKPLNQHTKAIKDSEEYQSLQDRLKGSRMNGNQPITSRSPSSSHPSDLSTISRDSPVLSSIAAEIPEPEPDLEPQMTLSSSAENPATNLEATNPNGMSNLEVFIDDQLDRWLLDKDSEYSLSDIETFINGLPYM
ncbi:hypothetical protein ARMGADRAFT_1076409 [Armillaria gallica]|uniref:Uncharacterized protein n=1 Tax=Armillaria gallica TaxID=47427 RepID=A0A2H3DVR1_ARMGA|nr:hypothetical protein ARMGADRAFT_1076409 [Armillaria gallica]